MTVDRRPPTADHRSSIIDQIISTAIETIKVVAVNFVETDWAMRSRLKSLLLLKNIPTLPNLPFRKFSAAAVCCFLTSASVCSLSSHSINSMSSSTRRPNRQSAQLFQSVPSLGDETPLSKKRIAPSTPNTSMTNTTAISYLEQADRRTLQAEAKKHGIKANQKSCILRTELEAILTATSTPFAPLSFGIEQPVPVTPDDTMVSSPIASPTKKQKKASLKRKSSTKNVFRAAPKDWLATYRLVEELREDRSAPVDTDGSEALPEKDKGLETYRFQVLIALMLSSQTKDAVVGDAMRKLQKHGLTVENIQQTPPDKLNELIGRVGFHNNKTKYIKQTVEILKKEYNCDIPPTSKEMMALPGVGPKMAFIVENVAWGKQTGIGVDTHMHRIFNQLKWVDSKNPEQTRMQLESWLSKEYWESINLLWVGFGQEVQQFKPKMLRKALDSSNPKAALQLVKRLGLDYRKEGKKLDLEEEIAAALKK